MRENLLIVRAGDASLHPSWLSGNAPRTFDLYVSYYGSLPGRYAGQCDYYEAATGPKFPPLARILANRWDVVRQYRFVGFPDDDLYADSADWDRLFAVMADHQVDLGQPAIIGHVNWPHTAPRPGMLLRWAGPVEVMTPVFSRRALDAARWTFAESVSGWGNDLIWADQLPKLGYGLAVIDAVTVEHTRPWRSGELSTDVYPNLGVDPGAENMAAVNRYGLASDAWERSSVPLPTGVRWPAAAADGPVVPPGPGRVYSFGPVGERPLTRTLMLHPDGTVRGYDCPNERAWEVRDGTLHLLDGDGRVTCRFPTYDPYGRLLVGRNFLGKPHGLRDETDAWVALPPKRQFEVVVARHAEGLAWTEVVSENVTVYNKGPRDDRWTSLPDRGRESATYLHHIVHHWDDLADHTLFIQGDPFAHQLYPLPMYAEGDFVAPSVEVQASEATFLTAASKAAFWRRYVRTTPVPRHTAHTPGSQFSASASAIRRRGLPFWYDLYELSQADELRFEDAALDAYGIGLLIEYAWPYLVNARGLPTVDPVPIRGTYCGRTTTRAAITTFFGQSRAP